MRLTHLDGVMPFMCLPCIVLPMTASSAAFREIARAYGVSELFCSRFVAALEHGLVKLAAMAACASDVQHRTFRCSMLLRVTEETSPWRALKTMPPNALVDSCALNSALREALNAFFAVLMKYGIADLVRRAPNVRHLRWSR